METTTSENPFLSDKPGKYVVYEVRSTGDLVFLSYAADQSMVGATKAAKAQARLVPGVRFIAVRLGDSYRAEVVQVTRLS